MMITSRKPSKPGSRISVENQSAADRPPDPNPWEELLEYYPEVNTIWLIDECPWN